MKMVSLRERSSFWQACSWAPALSASFSCHMQLKSGRSKKQTSLSLENNLTSPTWGFWSLSQMTSGLLQPIWTRLDNHKISISLERWSHFGSYPSLLRHSQLNDCTARQLAAKPEAQRSSAPSFILFFILYSLFSSLHAWNNALCHHHCRVQRGPTHVQGDAKRLVGYTKDKAG